MTHPIKQNPYGSAEEHQIVEHLVRLIVPAYTLEPHKLRVFRKFSSTYIQPSDTDFRLVVGKGGRNLEALRTISNFACRPHIGRIDVVEPGQRTDPLPARAMVGNDAHPKEADDRMASLLFELLELIGAEPNTVAATREGDEFTTSLNVTTDIIMDQFARQSVSILFGAVGRVNGRNVRVRIATHDGDNPNSR